MEAQEILEHIDAYQGFLPFFVSDGRVHLADTRLTVFRSSHDWAIFVEVPHHCCGTDDFHNWIGGTGSCLLQGDYYSGDDDDIGRRSLFEEVPEAPLWKYGAYKTWVGDRACFSIMFKGERFDFTPTDADYAEAGIVFEEKQTGPDSISPGFLLRFLCHHLDHPFFASEAELRSLVDGSSGLELFLQTRHWHHPAELVDFGLDSTPDQHICNIPCFQILSRAIASGDLTEWNSQDPTTFNTHWENLEAIRHECFESQKPKHDDRGDDWVINMPNYF